MGAGLLPTSTHDVARAMDCLHVSADRSMKPTFTTKTERAGQKKELKVVCTGIHMIVLQPGTRMSVHPKFLSGCFRTCAYVYPGERSLLVTNTMEVFTSILLPHV